MSQEKEIIVGGQAVLEGVMMRAPNSYAVAVRRQNGSIAFKAERLPKLSEKYPILKIPVLRGSVVLLHSMMLGIKALNFSAEVAFEDQAAEEASESKVARAAAATGALATTAHAIETDISLPSQPLLSREDTGKIEKSSSTAATATAVGSIAFALIFNVILFIVLPLLLTNVIFVYFGLGNAAQLAVDHVQTAESWYREAIGWLQDHLKPVRPSVSFNLIDGLIRMGLFVLMIFTFSRQRDVKRVFEYHGAEHKTVYAWEAGQELTVDNAKRHPR